jgi:hypothetical protein
MKELHLLSPSPSSVNTIVAPINPEYSSTIPTGIVDIAYDTSDDGTMARNFASSIDELSTMVDSVTLRVFSQPVRANRRTDTVNIRASSDIIGTSKQSVAVHRRDGVPSLALWSAPSH